MSSFITTSININEKKNQVFLSGYSSNVYPKKSQRFESTYLSSMLKDEGRNAVDAYLLDQYQGGMMRGGNNEYTQSVAIYKEYTLDALNRLRRLKKLSRGKKFIISTNAGDAPYLLRIKQTGATLTMEKSRAKQMNKIDALVKASKFKNVHVVEV